MKTFTAKKIFKVNILKVSTYESKSVSYECPHCSIAFFHIIKSTILLHK